MSKWVVPVFNCNSTLCGELWIGYEIRRKKRTRVSHTNTSNYILEVSEMLDIEAKLVVQVEPSM